MTLKDIFAKAPPIDCVSITDLPTAQAKLLAGIPALVICDAATIGYIDAKGDYYCPDLECNVNLDNLDAESLQGICIEYTKAARYTDAVFPIRLAWVCGKDSKFI